MPILITVIHAYFAVCRYRCDKAMSPQASAGNPCQSPGELSTEGMSFSLNLRSSRSDPLAPSLATLGSGSDKPCPSSLLQRNQLSLLPNCGGLLLVASPDGCAVAVLNREDIRGDKIFNHYSMTSSVSRVR